MWSSIASVLRAGIARHDTLMPGRPCSEHLSRPYILTRAMTILPHERDLRSIASASP
jgi:hypothetical protein